MPQRFLVLSSPLYSLPSHVLLTAQVLMRCMTHLFEPGNASYQYLARLCRTTIDERLAQIITYFCSVFATMETVLP